MIELSVIYILVEIPPRSSDDISQHLYIDFKSMGDQMEGQSSREGVTAPQHYTLKPTFEVGFKLLWNSTTPPPNSNPE